jgi:hypothetical protein
MDVVVLVQGMEEFADFFALSLTQLDHVLWFVSELARYDRPRRSRRRTPNPSEP